MQCLKNNCQNTTFIIFNIKLKWILKYWKNYLNQAIINVWKCLNIDNKLSLFFCLSLYTATNKVLTEAWWWLSAEFWCFFASSIWHPGKGWQLEIQHTVIVKISPFRCVWRCHTRKRFTQIWWDMPIRCVFLAVQSPPDFLASGCSEL